MESQSLINQDHAAIIAEQIVIAASKITKDLATVKNCENKKSTFLQYIITSILSIIAIVSVSILFTVRNVQTLQTEQGKELVRLKTVQDNNVQSITSIGSRVSVLEINQTEIIKAWVELNFIRKQ